MRAYRSLPSILVATSFFGGAGCGGDAEPPPKVAREGAGVQVRRVATRWTDTVEEEGFLENDPNGVVQFRVFTKRTLTLGEGDSVTLRVERDERFETRVGTFRCKAKGDLPGVATYAWQAGEAELRLRLPDASLPRACDPPGFPVAAKVLPAQSMVLVLRSDRLIGRTSARDRTVLLPMP